MTDVIAHRGPDGEGTFVQGPVGLGHRRLAVLDLTPAGRQPMASADGRYAISYNGEVYNHAELRAELQANGHQFHSRTDTEVVLHALIEWGTAALDRFNGMFAFALWDAKTKRLLLARDRYGVKPLYYTQRGHQLVFASEVKAILAHPKLSAELDTEALLEYFTFQNFFTDRTLFSQVRLLPPGTFIEIEAKKGATPKLHRYWDWDFIEPEKAEDDQAYVEEIHRLFQQAVQRQLVADVEVGAYLSGGIDSGAIASVAAENLPYVKTFTCGFDMHSASSVEAGTEQDERARAEYVSHLLKTEHYEMVLKAGDMERVLPRFTWHLEEPRVGQSYPNFYIAQLTSKFVKVVLSGAGGDEIFGGYPWRYYRAVVNDDFEHYVTKYYRFWQRLIPNGQIRHVLAPVWSDVGHIDTRDLFRDVFAGHTTELTRPEDYVARSLYFESKTFLHGLLTVEDKLSMAHGLEARVPFLDNDLVDFAMRLPAHLRLGNLTEIVRLNENEPGPKTTRYFQKTRDGKLLLRKMVETYLPKNVAQAAKHGFSAPDQSWFREDSVGYVRRMLYDDRARIYEYLDPKPVRRLVDDHLDGTENRRLLIWSLLNVEWWLRTFV